LTSFGPDLVGAVRTSLDDLAATFAGTDDQGPTAYAEQMQLDHPALDPATLAADSVLAVDAFHARLFGTG
jgi:hypothetical protein